jgi:adenosylhomocysteine nucleosidase
MVGVICAMDCEASLIVQSMTDVNGTSILGMKLYQGLLYDKPIMLIKSNTGKVHAALAAQLLTQAGYDHIFNVGCAGSLVDDVKMGDIVMADSTIQYDYKIVKYPRGAIPAISKHKPSIFPAVVIDNDKINEIHVGMIASGDKFVTDKVRIRKYTENKAIACDMESGAVGQVCFLYGIKYSVIRCISDNADGKEYQEIAASDRAAQFFLELMYDGPIYRAESDNRIQE